MSSTQQTGTVKTSEIHVGDIVREHGMRVRIDSIKYHAAQAPRLLPVCACRGTVLNLDEVLDAKIVPASFLTTEKWVEGEGWVTDRRDAWTVQGNDLATWSVETPEPELAEYGGFAVRGAFVEDAQGNRMDRVTGAFLSAGCDSETDAGPACWTPGTWSATARTTSMAVRPGRTPSPRFRPSRWTSRSPPAGRPPRPPPRLATWPRATGSSRPSTCTPARRSGRPRSAPW
jgi:hypothetical protein